MAKYKFLAFDFGASNGRAMLATLEKGKITLEEKHRFPNDSVSVNGGMYTDSLRLFHEIKQGILACANSGDRDITSIGIDTWGVDYGMLDKDDQLIGNPYHYRDTRTDGMIEKVCEKVSEKEIFEETGVAFNWFNTLYQVYSEKLADNLRFREGKTLLFTPDLFNFFLTGKKRVEYTIASTSQMFDSKNHTWAEGILGKLGLSSKIFPEMIYPGEKVGELTEEIAEELGVARIPVMAVASHDTGSAVASVPVVDQDDFIYISSGTWSLMGVELKEPIVSEKSRKFNFTNEGGVNKTIRFLKSIMGLWLVQESRRQWGREGELLSFGELADLASKEKPFVSFIDPDYEDFQTPGNMPEKIRNYCRKTNQPVPETKGEVVRCITQSLAFKYRKTIEDMEEVTNKKYSVINIVGGGIQDKMLCQFTANATGRTVEAGPVEATAIGNAIVQAMAAGVVKDLNEGRKIIKNSFDIAKYEPQDSEEWNKAYEKWLSIVSE